MEIHQPDPTNPVASRHKNDWRGWLPTRGNVLFVLVVAGAMLLLADSGGSPLNGSYSMSFRLYNVASGGSALWTETWLGGNSVLVSSGLFNVMLGTLTPISQTVLSNSGGLWLGIMVEADTEMTPRVQLGSAPFSMQALTVPDGSVSASKLAADVKFNLSGWERDESSTSNPIQQFEPNLLLQHGYAQHKVTSLEISAGYFDYQINFPTPFKSGTVPTVVITYGGESANTSDIPKGGSANGVGISDGRIVRIGDTGFVLRAQGFNADRNDLFYWIAIGQAP